MRCTSGILFPWWCDPRLSGDRGTVWQVLGDVARHPLRELVWKWNYKSALTSALIRGLLYFLTNLSAGLVAATGALTAEFLLRLAVAGFYGALTQAFRRVVPERSGTIAAMVLLPAIAHALEWVVHWFRSTPALALSVALSICLTAITTSFNLFAMRRGALVVGEADSRSLFVDLARLPRLILAFALSAWPSKRFI
jgi:hypothetical protein